MMSKGGFGNIVLPVYKADLFSIVSNQEIRHQSNIG